MSEPAAFPPLDAGTVDAENPWPGLAAFREADCAFFHGRESETAELVRRVLRERLTILFGLSGLGKTSLLQAGLFPRLRDESILPVSIRLDYSASRRPLLEQIREAVARAAAAAGIEAPPPRAGETLWESFHREGAEYWSPRNRLVTPLLAIDQLEEIFTLGEQSADGARETSALLGELAALCDGTPPRPVRARLDANPHEIRDFFFDRHPYKLLFSLREDFLPDLEALRDRISSIVHNRMRLRGMNGQDAMQVVTQEGRADRLPLVDASTAEKIVRFVASQDEASIPLSALDVEPALLSFVCRELNNKRRLQGSPRITVDLLAGTRDTIFVDFYERSTGDLDPRVRPFIEDHLLTKSGYRDSVALENAPDVITAEVLAALTDRRLLRIEDRGGLPRIELTHDVLTGVIRSSRDTRRQREEQAKAEAAREEAEAREEEARRQLRRSRLVIAALGLLLAGTLGLFLWGWNAEKKARRALASAEVERALHTLQAGRSASALAYFAHAVRIDPENLQARGRLTDLLFHRAWLLPARELQKMGTVQRMQFSRDGRRLLVVNETTVAVWDAATARQVGLPLLLKDLGGADLSRDGELLFTRDRSGNGRLLKTGSHQPLGPSLPLGEILSFELSPDGLLLAALKLGGTVDLQETRSGALTHHLALPRQKITAVSFSPEPFRLVTVSRPESWPDRPEEITFWDTRTGTYTAHPLEPSFQDSLSKDLEHPSPLGLKSGGQIAAGKVGTFLVFANLATGKSTSIDVAKAEISSFELSQDGRFLLTLATDHSVRLWDAKTGQPLFEPLEGIAEAHISPDGRSLVTVSLEGQACLWPIRTGYAEPDRLTLDPATYRVEISLDGARLAAFSKGGLRLWNLSSLLPEGDPRPVPFYVAEARFSADGRKLAACGGKRLGVWDLRTGAVSDGTLGGLRTLDFSPDGKRLATGSTNGTAQIWDVQDLGRPAHILAHKGRLTTVRFSPDGQWVVTASEDHTARLWNARTGVSVGLPMQHGDPVSWAKFSPDGQRIVTTARGREVFIWQSPSGSRERRLPHKQTTYYAEPSLDSSRMVTTTLDGTVWLWDLRAARLLAGVRPVEGQVSQIVISPDGERFAVLLPRAPEVRLWSIQAGEALGDHFRREGATFWGAGRFTPDGERLVIAGNDEALIWDVPLLLPREGSELADLAEAVAGSVVTESGKLASLANPAALLEKLRRKTAGARHGTASASSLTRWFLSDPWTRTTSPLSRITVPEFIRRRLAEGTDKAREEVDRAYPGYPLAPLPPA